MQSYLQAGGFFFFFDCWGAYSCWIHYFYSVHFIQIVPNLCRLKALWIEREKMHYRTMWACQIKAWSEREEGRRDAQCFTRGTPATWAYTRITKGWFSEQALTLSYVKKEWWFLNVQKTVPIWKPDWKLVSQVETKHLKAFEVRDFCYTDMLRDVSSVELRIKEVVMKLLR